MKKVLLFCLIGVCAIAFSFTGCDDEEAGLTCAEQIKSYKICINENGLEDPQCMGIIDDSCRVK